MLDRWKTTLRELEKDLSVNERLWSLIRDIDTQIVRTTNARPIDDFEASFKGVLTKFFQLYNLPGPSVTFIADQALANEAGVIVSDHVGTRYNTKNSGLVSDNEAIICHQNHPYFLVSHAGHPNTRHYPQNVLETYPGILLQLEALLSAQLAQHYTDGKKNVYDNFFSSELKPAECWNTIAACALKFIPPWTEAKIPAETLVQVLLYEQGDRLIPVVGSNDANSSLNKHVRVDRSVTGKAIKNPDQPWLLVNPREENFRHSYVGYRKNMPSSELVVLLHHDDAVIGALNIESKDENAFSQFHIHELSNYATFISPIVHALNERYRAYHNKTISLTYAYLDMLERLRRTYRHLLGQPMSLMGSGIAEIRYQINNPTDDSQTQILGALQLIKGAKDAINQHSIEFFANVPSYLNKDKVSVLQCINDRIGFLKSQAKEEGIDIQVSVPEDIYVFASRFLQEHIFNIVKNSFDAVLHRLRDAEISSGLINIIANEIDEQDALSNHMNFKSVLIEISDNGGGASDNNLENIGRSGFTTKGVNGNGFGVAAAKDFIETMSGTMEWSNIYQSERRTGFRTTLKLPSFNNELHGITGV